MSSKWYKIKIKKDRPGVCLKKTGDRYYACKCDGGSVLIFGIGGAGGSIVTPDEARELADIVYKCGDKENKSVDYDYAFGLSR